jgi:hypothetical protein
MSKVFPESTWAISTPPLIHKTKRISIQRRAALLLSGKTWDAKRGR